MSRSNYTGRVSRTLEEAYGPYHRNTLYEKKEPLDGPAIAIVVAGVITIIFSAFIIINVCM